MARVISAERTPNPMAVKLCLDQKVTVGGGLNYTKKEEAWESPLAQKILDVHGVVSVFLMEDFITITKTPGGIWDYIFFQVNEIVRAERDLEPLSVGNEAKAASKNVSREDFEGLNGEEKLAHIDRVIDETVRPGLARDGGNLELVGLEGLTLTVKYQGACGTCPSATGQTLQYIANTLQARVHPAIIVVPL